MLPGWGNGNPKVGSVKGNPMVIGPRENPQWTDMAIKSSGIRDWRHFGGRWPGPGSLGFRFLQCSTTSSPKQCINGESKVRICFS